MKEENPPKEINECKDLTLEQQAGILANVDKILKPIEEITDNKEVYEFKKQQIINFSHVMEDEGLSIYDYVLGRRLMGNTGVKLEGPFDTTDHNIQEYIEEELMLKKTSENKKDNLNNVVNPIKKDYSHLKAEEIGILSEMRKILKLEEKPTKETYPEWENMQKKIILIIKELEDKGINPGDYILGYVIKAGTPIPEVVKFDTPNHDIEKEIRKLK